VSARLVGIRTRISKPSFSLPTTIPKRRPSPSPTLRKPFATTCRAVTSRCSSTWSSSRLRGVEPTDAAQEVCRPRRGRVKPKAIDSSSDHRLATLTARPAESVHGRWFLGHGPIATGSFRRRESWDRAALFRNRRSDASISAHQLLEVRQMTPRRGCTRSGRSCRSPTAFRLPFVEGSH